VMKDVVEGAEEYLERQQPEHGERHCGISCGS
jgi:hypothetical protein